MIFTIIARAMSEYQVNGAYYCYHAISSGSLVLQLPGGQFIKALLDLLKGDITNGTTKLIQAIADTTLLGAGLGAGVAMLPNEFNSTLSNSTSDAACDLPTIWDPQAMPVSILRVRLLPAINFSLALAIFFWSEKQQFRQDIGPQATIAFMSYSVSFGLSYVKSLAVIHAGTGTSENERRVPRSRFCTFTRDDLSSTGAGHGTSQERWRAPGQESTMTFKMPSVHSLQEPCRQSGAIGMTKMLKTWSQLHY